MQWQALDTETDGFDDPKAVEIACVRDDGLWGRSYVKNVKPISFGAMATHLITEMDLMGAPDLEVAMNVAGLRDDCVCVAHNAKFDKGVVAPYLQDVPWVCTWKVAMRLVPDAESHSNMALWFELGLARRLPDEAGSMPHRALFDSFVTSDLMRHFLWSMDIEEMIKVSAEPVLLKKVRFGKHRDQLWRDVPLSYMEWCLTQDFDEDTLHTCRHYLGLLVD